MSQNMKSEWPTLFRKEGKKRCRRLTGHYPGVAVAVGQNIVERRLLGQTTDDGGLGKSAHFTLLLGVEGVHLVS